MFVKHKSLLFLFTVIFILTACANADNNDNQNSPNNSTSESENSQEENTPQDDDIDGTMWGEDGDIGVILSHGAVYDADSWKEQGEQLAEEGMVAFAVEDTDPETLIAAANILEEEQGVGKIVIIGASAGGGTAIEAVNKAEVDFDRVILLSPGGDATSIANIPVLAIYSEEEGFEELEEAAETTDNLEAISIPGSAHAQELFQDDEKAEQVMEEIINFINKE